MTAAITETLRFGCSGWRGVLYRVRSSEWREQIAQSAQAISGVVASCLAAGIMFSASLHPELKPLARDLVSPATHLSIAFGTARSDGKNGRSDLLITNCPPLSEAALKSLIDEAIVPAMMDSFLAQKGLVASYARYSSDLQRNSSIEDQFRTCRGFAAHHPGWTVLEKYVVADEAISGAAKAGRNSLNFLIEEAKRKPRPFDCILIDDTSRLARNVGDALKMVEGFHYYGVRVIFITQGIDTADKTARQLLTFNGMMDEQYLVGLADKVHRGQEGRVMKGFSPGGKC